MAEFEDPKHVIERLWPHRHNHYGERMTLRSMIHHLRIERDTERRERGEMPKWNAT
jgi:hypothetical protein